MSLQEALIAHVAAEPREEADRARMALFAAHHRDPFDRAIVEGHFTASGLVISEDGDSVLLLHHIKLQRWLHPTAPQPFDVDIHTIPARKVDPEHEHLDLRYLFVASVDEPLRAEAPEEPSGLIGAGLRWFRVDEALAMDLDPGLKRMIRKAHAIVTKN